MTTPTFLDVDPEDDVLVRSHFPDARIFHGHQEGQEVIADCKDAEIISTFITEFPRSILDQLPALKLLCTRSVGYDHIDVDACREKGIIVCNVPDYGSHVIAEHVFALLLSTLRHIQKGQERVAEGRFDYHGLRGMSLHSKTIGIVGTGHIGRVVAKIAHGFSMKIVAVDLCRVLELEEKYGVEYVTLPQLLSQSDIITLHVPALPATKDMINAETIAQMKDGVILVNTARGSLLDVVAVKAALDSGKIRHALLDVLENETNVELDAALVQHPSVVVTPHIAFYADDSVKAMYADSIDSIERYLRGEKPVHTVEPLHVVCDLPGVKTN